MQRVLTIAPSESKSHETPTEIKLCSSDQSSRQTNSRDPAKSNEPNARAPSDRIETITIGEAAHYRPFPTGSAS